ncbi:MAG TPA: lysine--tRNA ligase, partial [Sphaerochaeta sp.]|nr:lysine--tRNA ligase [Sphaerochaeta sp.]
RKAKESRIYELSQVGEVPIEVSYQIPFRHLCNLLQLHEGDIDRALATLEDATPGQLERLKTRAICAWNWITTFSPEDFRFRLMKDSDSKVEIEGAELAAIHALREVVKEMNTLDEQTYTTRLYDAAKDNGLDTGDFFKLVYRVLIGRSHGPKLASFLETIGREKALEILSRY